MKKTTSTEMASSVTMAVTVKDSSTPRALAPTKTT